VIHLNSALSDASDAVGVGSPCQYGTSIRKLCLCAWVLAPFNGSMVSQFCFWPSLANAPISA